MKWKYFNYVPEGHRPTVCRLEEGDSILINTSTDLQVDGSLLLPIFVELHKYSQRIYAHLLTLLEHNNKPITVRASQLKVATTPNIKSKDTFDQYVVALIRAGLIVRKGRNNIYINPVFAWKPGSEDCFDPNEVPTLSQIKESFKKPDPQPEDTSLRYKSGKKKGQIRLNPYPKLAKTE